MNTNSLVITPNPQLINLLEDCFNNNIGVALLSISTMDGFNIHTLSRQESVIESDKLAAISSALCSLSDASAEQIVNQNFILATVETGEGKILFLKARYLAFSCVVCMASTVAMSLAEARFLARRLADAIKDLQ
jgi:predicted regulator of Ras-like GTPase activity (Roadblock/LC7/MglB family)